MKCRRENPALAAERARAAAEQRKTDRAARRAHIARELDGTAKGFRYAIECEVGWVGPNDRPGPKVHDDRCTHATPVIYEGDRESAQARAQIHAERNSMGGATHHSPMIVPESEIAKRAAVRGWK